MGDLNLWWDRYGLKLLALIAAALIIGAITFLFFHLIKGGIQ